MGYLAEWEEVVAYRDGFVESREVIHVLYQRTAEELQITRLYWHAHCFIYWVDSFMLTLICISALCYSSFIVKTGQRHDSHQLLWCVVHLSDWLTKDPLQHSFSLQ